MVAVAQERIDEVCEEQRARAMDFLPYSKGDGVRAGGRIAGGAGEGIKNFTFT